MRQLLRGTLLTAVFAAGGVSPALAQSIISQPTAARYGLTRAWYAQVGSPRISGTPEQVVYDKGLVLVQSSRGMLTAIDAQTGRALWATQIGDGSNTEPAANDKHIVVLNGSTLYVLSRADGHIVWQRPLGAAPNAGAGVSQTHAFFPLISGKVEGYDLEAGAAQTPWNFQSTGHVLTPPLTTETTVNWATDAGYLYVADPAGGGIRYRLETGDEIHARPGAWSPRLFAGSADGYVYAVDEIEGTIAWEYSTGEAIYERPVALGDSVFVVTQFGGLYCIDATSGRPAWHARNIAQFVAASPSRVYARDRVGRLSILDITSGALLGSMPLSGIEKQVVNSSTDRIILVSNSGMVQCLHETQLRSPVGHTPPPPPEKAKIVPKPTERKPAEKEPPAAADPFDAPPTDNPFEAEMPEEPAEELENPFDP